MIHKMTLFILFCKICTALAARRRTKPIVRTVNSSLLNVSRAAAVSIFNISVSSGLFIEDSVSSSQISLFFEDVIINDVIINVKDIC